MSVQREFSQQRRLKVAVLNRIFRPTGGGAERYSIALVEQLATRHEIHVFAQQIEHAHPGVIYHRVPTPLLRPRWINQLWFALATWWLTRRGFDVVHSHENTWHGAVQTVHVVPVQYNLFDQRDGWRRALRWVKVLTSVRLLVYLALEWARYRPQPGRIVVLASDALRPRMAHSFPNSVRSLRVLTPGVSAVPGPATLAEKSAARQTLQLPASGRCILFVGNDYRKKGLPALLAALRMLPAQYFVAVVGNAAQIAGMREEVSRGGVLDRVFFLGALDHVDTAYRAADCLVHPTLEDTYAMVVLEAMAFGLPVVVSGVAYCGIAEQLRDGQDALILQDPRNADSIARAVACIFDSNTLGVALREAGCAFARKNLWTDVARRQEQMYFEAARASDDPAKGSS